MMKSILTFALVFGMAGQAVAFKLQLTQTGKLIRWDKAEITIHLDSSLELLGPINEVEEEISDAFDTWVADADLPISFKFVSSDCKGAHYSSSSNNQNCIFAVDQLLSNEEDIGGTTTVTFSDDSGKIVDADMAFFTSAGEWTLNGEVGKLDVYSVALHEVGHLLGLAHSEMDDATMYAMTSLDAPAVQSLHDDDIYGAEALYDQHRVADTSCTAVPSGSGSSLGLLSLLF